MNTVLYQRITAAVVVVFSLIGLTASLILSIEEVNHMLSPESALSCTINSKLNCKKVMDSPTSRLFGFPNSYLGLIFYSILLSYGLFGFFVKQRNFLLDTGYSIIAGIGFLFSYWLLYISTFVIESFCIYCLISCFAATNIFFAFIYAYTREFLYNRSHFLRQLLDRGIHFYLISLWYVIAVLTVYIKEIFK